MVGWSWLIEPHRWRYTGRATERVLAIEMDGVCMRNKCEDNHHLGYDLMKRFSSVMAHRLEATRLQLLDVYGMEEVRS